MMTISVRNKKNPNFLILGATICLKIKLDGYIPKVCQETVAPLSGLFVRPRNVGPGNKRGCF